MDRTKESLFNILGNRLSWENTDMADLFAGTGNISLEACSRGARKVIAVDVHVPCCRFIRGSAELLDFQNLIVQSQDVLKWVKDQKDTFDFIFLDPPYQMPGQAELVQSLYSKFLRPEGWLVLEHALQGDYSHLEGFQEIRSYGQSAFSFYHKPE
jgi:16S rRNA (guanine(966)-N(2))-methyltransferase RsmD